MVKPRKCRVGGKTSQDDVSELRKQVEKLAKDVALLQVQPRECGEASTLHSRDDMEGPQASPPLSVKLEMYARDVRSKLSAIPMPTDVSPTSGSRGQVFREYLIAEYFSVLNTGSREELRALPELGDARVDSLLALRKDDPIIFKTIDDLQALSISPKQFETIMKSYAAAIIDEQPKD